MTHPLPTARRDLCQGAGTFSYLSMDGEGYDYTACTGCAGCQPADPAAPMRARIAAAGGVFATVPAAPSDEL